MAGGSGKLSAAKRRQKRVKMVLAVRLFKSAHAGPAENLAHTLDVTVDGVKIAGLHEPLTAGEVVVLQRGPMKRPFRVMWAAAVGREYQAGLQAVEPLRDFWRLDLPEEPDDYYNPDR
jgi:hypothetical protein